MPSLDSSCQLDFTHTPYWWLIKCSSCRAELPLVPETVKHHLTQGHVKEIGTAAQLRPRLPIIHVFLRASCCFLPWPDDLLACQLCCFSSVLLNTMTQMDIFSPPLSSLEITLFPGSTHVAMHGWIALKPVHPKAKCWRQVSQNAFPLTARSCCLCENSKCTDVTEMIASFSLEMTVR